MSYLPSQVTKTKKLREGFRRTKRRQLATIAAGIVVVIALCVGLVLLGIFVKSLLNRDTAISHESFSRQQPNSTLIKSTMSTLLQPAPGFVLMAEDGLIIAGDTTGGKAGFPSTPIDFLAAYSEDSAESNWRMDHSEPVTSLDIAENRIIAFRQMLSEPPGIELSGYDIENGTQVWKLSLELAKQGCIEIAGNVVCISYQMPDGPRIAGYNCETGTKAWGLRVPFDENNPGTAFADQVYMETGGSCQFLAYYIDRFFGILDTTTGKLIRRYAGDGVVIDGAISWSESQVFLSETGLSENDYRLITFPFRDGSPVVIHEYEAQWGAALLSSGLYAILVFNEPAGDGGEEASGFVAGFTTEPTGPKFVHQLIPGFVDDAIAVPETVGEFLLASNSRQSINGKPRGQGRLLRISFSNQGMEETARFNQPISWLVPFTDQCVVLLQGGRVVSYINDLKAAVLIDRMRFANLEPVMNQSRDSLAVLSYKDSYTDGKSGGMMAVTVFD